MKIHEKLSPGGSVMRERLRYTVHSISDDAARVQVVNPDGLYSVFPAVELTRADAHAGIAAICPEGVE